MDLFADVVGALGLVGGVIGFFVARAANSKAADAQASATNAATDAAKALTRSAIAQEESAAALKRANELHEQALAPDFEWKVQQVSDTAYILRPEGKMWPRNAQLFAAAPVPERIVIQDGGPRDLKPGDSFAFLVSRSKGRPGRPTVRVEWDDDREPGERQEQIIVIP